MTKTYDEDGNLITTTEEKEEEEKLETKEESEEEVKKDEEKSENVSLSKYMKLKKKFQDLEKSNTNIDEDTKKILEDFKKERIQKQIDEAFEEDVKNNLSNYELDEVKKKTLKALMNLEENEDKSIEDIYLETWNVEKVTFENSEKKGTPTSKEYNFDNLTQKDKEEIYANPELNKKYMDYIDEIDN